MEVSKEQFQLIKRVANENGFSDYEVVTIPGSFKGDNFMGIVTAVTIKNGERKLELILKSAHTKAEFRKMAPVHEAYDREIFMYGRIFEEFRKFQEEYKIEDPFKCTAKAYAFSTQDGHECFIMENLKMDGYQLWDKKIPMNSEHVKAVVKEYAKFHAISLAMTHLKPHAFQQLTDKVSLNIFETSEYATNEERFNRYISAVLANGYKALENDIVLTECLKKIESKLPYLILNLKKTPEYKLVIDHGDGWCNNFLFKYKDLNEKIYPSDLRILDWQLAGLTSPAQDFCYFFLINSSKEVLDDYKTYTRFYYDTLSSQLRNFNCDADKLFPYATFENHLKNLMLCGMHTALMILKIMLCDSEEVPDFSKLSETETEITKGLGFKMKNFDEYKERITVLMQFLKNNDFID